MADEFLGLAADEWADIHQSVMEAAAFVALPVTFYRPVAGQAVDPLYGEPVDGDTDWEPWATIRASVKEQPANEQLTQMGLKLDKDLLLFIPHGYILAWQAKYKATFKVEEFHEVAYRGVRYNIEQVREDDLPVGDGSAADFVGLVVTGTTKPKA
jgi:hypothetical protein